MPQLIIDIPDAIATEVVDAYARIYMYDPGKGPKAAFPKKVLVQHLKDTIIAFRRLKRSEAVNVVDEEVSIS